MRSPFIVKAIKSPFYLLGHLNEPESENHYYNREQMNNRKDIGVY